jgi:hypothetical protein
MALEMGKRVAGVEVGTLYSALVGMKRSQW